MLLSLLLVQRLAHLHHQTLHHQGQPVVFELNQVSDRFHQDFV